MRQIIKAVAPVIIALGASLLLGCSGSQKVDWAGLATEAAPEFRKGPCGPEVVWTKDLEVYADVEVVGELTVRRKCSQQ